MPVDRSSVAGRILAEDAADDEGAVIVAAGADLTAAAIDALLAGGVTSVKVRSVLTCASAAGVCARCYGRSTAAGKLIDIGEAVGILAAQSIGEPGTQLTLRIVHRGAVVGEDITGGLPRVERLFEARDDKVHELLRVRGAGAAARQLICAVQEVYRGQGVSIHDKHVEVIVRQMLRLVGVIDSGGTTLHPGSLVSRRQFDAENRRILAEGGQPATARPLLTGITKASLATDSWLSAASFQETTRVLTDAAIHGRTDHLHGLKENMIVGKRIPAGTGIRR
jgi:DNA-directed RNA polymerase subunit beta'